MPSAAGPVFVAAQVSSQVVQILTSAGILGGISTIAKIVLDWRSQSVVSTNASDDREDRLRKQIRELEELVILREDQVAEMRKQLRSAEVLLEAQTSTIALDARKMTLLDEELRFLRRRVKTLEGNDGSGD